MSSGIINRGSRFSVLHGKAESLFSAGKKRHDVLNTIIQENITRCRPPLSQIEVIHLVNSIYAQRTLYD